jgi:predicted RNA-binding protein with TRAM domain
MLNFKNQFYMRNPHTLQLKAFYLMPFKYLCATMLFLLFSSHLFAADILMGQYEFTTGISTQLKATSVTQGITMDDIVVGTGSAPINSTFAGGVIETSNWINSMGISSGKCVNLSITKGSNASEFNVNTIIVTLKRTTANKIQINFGAAANTASAKMYAATGSVGTTSYVAYTFTEATGTGAVAVPAVTTTTPQFFAIGTQSASTSEVVYIDKIEVWGTVTTTPAVPNITSITPGDGQLSVAFTAGGDGGSAITNYEYSIDGGSNWITRSPAATTSPLTISGLTNGTPYNVQLRAVNAVGSGTATSTTSGTPASASVAPGAPSITSITSGNTQLSVAFTAGVDGGSAITNYEYSTDAGSTWTTRSPIATTSPILISSLTNGTSYNVQIRALNAVGTGAATASTAGTPSTTPSAPTITSITAGNSQLSVVFTTGSDGGSAITTYKYSIDGGLNFSTRQTGTTASPIVITGLSVGASYNVQIKAVNVNGDGIATATTAGTTNTTPSAPTITGITISSDTQLSVAITAGATGGSAITNYKYSIDGGLNFSTRQTGTTASPIVITGLTSGTSYNVQIKAVNANGDGAATATTASTTFSFYEDFANYDATALTNITLITLPTISNDVSLSRVAGWTGNFLYQYKAGSPNLGSVCLGSTATDSAYITTPAMDLSQPFTLTFKARSLNNATDGKFYVYLDGTQLIYSGIDNDIALTQYTTPAFVGTASSKLTFTGRKIVGNEIIIDGIGVSRTTCSSCDLTVAKDAILTISENKTYTNLSLAPGSKLTLGAGTLTVTNGITLESSALGTATIVDNNNSSPQAMSGTVQQYLATARNWYMSSPIVGATVPTGQTYYSYDETGNNTGFLAPASLYWVAVPEGATINPMKGYITQPGAAVTKSYTGTFNTGTKTVVLTRTNTATKPGFNLAANPYPSYLDWSLVDTTAANVLSSVWYRTKTIGGAYTFDTYNGGLNVATSNGENAVTKLIPPMQAFWVRVKSGYAGGTLTFDNTMRKHVDNVGNKFKAPTLSETKLIRLRISNGTNADETLIAFNNKATNNLDSYDSPKMLNNSIDMPEIYTQIGAEKLVINGMKDIPYDTEIPIGFVVGKAADLIISRTEISNFEVGTRILLKDKLYPTNEFDLSEGSSYNFSTPITIANTDRFSLIVRAPGISTGIGRTENLNAQVFVNAINQITIIAPEKSNYAIYNAMGQLMENGAITSTPQPSNFKHAAGVYVVKVNNQTTRVIIK